MKAKKAKPKVFLAWMFFDNITEEVWCWQIASTRQRLISEHGHTHVEGNIDERAIFIVPYAEYRRLKALEKKAG